MVLYPLIPVVDLHRVRGMRRPTHIDAIDAPLVATAGYSQESDRSGRETLGSITTWSSRAISEVCCRSWRPPRSCRHDEDPGEIEAAICEGITCFEQEHLGRGPNQIQAYLLGDFVVVRLQGLLTLAEQQLAKLPSAKGRDLVKQVRSHLIETAKPRLEALVQGVTGVPIVSLHHDISTVTSEAFVVLTLAAPPSYCDAK